MILVSNSNNYIVEFSKSVNELLNERNTDVLKKLIGPILNSVKIDYMFMSKFLKWFDEFQPNTYNIQHSRVLMLLQCYDKIEILFGKSIFRKLLESNDPKIIQTLLLDSTSGVTTHFFNEFNPINETILPLSTIVNTLNYTTANQKWLYIVDSIVNTIYFSDGFIMPIDKIENDFTTRADLIRKEKFTAHTIRYIIQVVLKGGEVLGSQSVMERLISYLCMMTFQNLTKRDIDSLKDDYIKLIPLIFTYGSSYRLRSFIGNDYRKPKKLTNILLANSYSQQIYRPPNYLYYLNEYYGKKVIEKEVLQFYKDWKSKRKNKEGVIRFLCFAQHVIDSTFARDNLQAIYDEFSAALIKTIPKPNLLYLFSVWGDYIERYGIANEKDFNQLRFYIVVESKINEKKERSHQVIYEFYITLLASNSQYTLSNFTEIVNQFVQKPCNFMVYLNQLLLKPPILNSMKTHENSNSLYNQIKEIGKISPEHFCYLLEFFMKYEKVSEYPKMVPQFIDAINSNKKWLVRDESFYITILKFYSILKVKNPKEAHQIFEKTIRSFVKSIDINKSWESPVKLDIIYPFIKDIKEINYLFKQTKELLTDSDQFVKIFKHLIDLDQIGQKYIQEYINSMIELKPSTREFMNTPFRTLKILDGLYRFINLDSQIFKLHSNYFQVISKYSCIPDGLKVISSNLLRSLHDFTLVYESFIDSLLYIDSDFIETQKFTYNLNQFNEIHQLLFYKNNNSIDIPQEDIIRIHNRLVTGIIKMNILPDLLMYQIKMIIMYFKPFKSIDQSLQDILLKQFQSLDIFSKKSILRYIKQNEIRVLEYLNDKSISGLSFNDINQQEQNLNSQTPYVQNLIIHNFVSFICRDKTTSPSDILSLSLVSKLFFKSVCLSFRDYKIQIHKHLNTKYQLSRGVWSFMSLGCHHLNYRDLERFHYQQVEDVFYQLSSLQIQKHMVYLVDKEMTNLTHLSVEIRDDMLLSCISNMMNHCHTLQSFKFSINTIDINLNRISHISNILQKLFSNNTETLKQLKFKYLVTFDRQFIQLIDSALQLIKNHEVAHPKTFKYQISLHLTMDLPIKIDVIRPLTTTCTHLILERYSFYLYQIKSDMFLNLKSMTVSADSKDYLLANLSKFVMSPEIELQSFSYISNYDPTLAIKDIIKKPNLKKFQMVINGSVQYLSSPKQAIDSILSTVNQNPTIKSLKIFEGGTTGYYGNYKTTKVPCIIDIHQLNCGDFHPLNNYHFIKYQ
ncbi:hypothetical protein DLAC_03487 [Tieghemostelium lacteum]|uniref:Uncharacterized protein n=1 Tax=Tieghemostelium lacteum TaxID=361077 RepID=A0A152A1B1_TIELA|nr:hypothetical protein DLAC_03487 [Tieghemostelium lacteum]|eukprot:KYQ99993.1 hypothetical protein DLAC_03487 [Tieghemostelium lacteum]